MANLIFEGLFIQYVSGHVTLLRCTLEEAARVRGVWTSAAGFFEVRLADGSYQCFNKAAISYVQPLTKEQADTMLEGLKRQQAGEQLSSARRLVTAG